MPGESALQTPLHTWHQSHGGRMVEFGGWSMPVQYTSIIDEHNAVRRRAGLFDISHMGRLMFAGPESGRAIDRLTTNAVERLALWQIQYSLMANEDGGLLDDVLVYRLQAEASPNAYSYLVVCNASNRPAVLERFGSRRDDGRHTLADRTLETAMIAVQGPAAREVAAKVVQTTTPLESLGYYHCTPAQSGRSEILVSRTGYTGEDGYELIVPRSDAVPVWEALLEAGKPFGVVPCGLGARDTLRFEAGMPLYGHELDETINPFEAGVGWVVKLKKGDFVGRDALVKLKPNVSRTRVGLALGGKRIARQGCPVLKDGRAVGGVTSGTFAPTLGRSLAMALVANEAAPIGTRLEIDVRGTLEPAEVVPLPFYKRDDR